MDFSGAILVSGSGWRGRPIRTKRRFDKYYFAAIMYKVVSLDDIVSRAAALLEHDLRMERGE